MPVDHIFELPTYKFLRSLLCSSKCRSISSTDEVKQKHSDILSAMLGIAHVLPLACKSEIIVKDILMPGHLAQEDEVLRSFHGRWTLGGWDDHIIQTARDAVLEYYKVRTCSQRQTLTSVELMPIQPTSVTSVMRSHRTMKNTYASITYPRAEFLLYPFRTTYAECHPITCILVNV